MLTSELVRLRTLEPAPDAMRVICRHGFDELRLHRIALTVVACFPRDGVWHDMVLMGLLEDELRQWAPSTSTTKTRVSLPRIPSAGTPARP